MCEYYPDENLSFSYSQEPNNLMNVSSFRYSGLVHSRSIGVTPSVDKKGIIFAYKKPKKMVSWRKPHSIEIREKHIFMMNDKS